MEGVGPEQNPGKADKGEGDGPMAKTAEAREPLLANAEGFLNAEQQTVQGAPQEEGSIGAMPDAADDKGDEQIEVVAQPAHTVAPQGNVDIVLEPG